MDIDFTFGELYLYISGYGNIRSLFHSLDLYDLYLLRLTLHRIGFIFGFILGCITVVIRFRHCLRLLPVSGGRLLFCSFGQSLLHLFCGRNNLRRCIGITAWAVGLWRCRLREVQTCSKSNQISFLIHNRRQNRITACRKFGDVVFLLIPGCLIQNNRGTASAWCNLGGTLCCGLVVHGKRLLHYQSVASCSHGHRKLCAVLDVQHITGRRLHQLVASTLWTETLHSIAIDGHCHRAFHNQGTVSICIAIIHQCNIIWTIYHKLCSGITGLVGFVADLYFPIRVDHFNDWVAALISD